MSRKCDLCRGGVGGAESCNLHGYKIARILYDHALRPSKLLLSCTAQVADEGGGKTMATLHQLTRVSMLVKRNPALSSREFQRQWCGVWGPLSAPFLKRLGFSNYSQVCKPLLSTSSSPSCKRY
jgi:hypothetical protein